MSLNLHLANVSVICATILQAAATNTGTSRVLDATAHPEAYQVYATELPTRWAQEKGTLLLQQETERPYMSDPCGYLKKQTGDWADAAKDFQEQNAHVWIVQAALPTIQYRLIRHAEIVAQDARVPGTFPGRPGVVQYAVVSAVGFNRDRTKAIVSVHLRLQGWVSKLELKDRKWQPVGETCGWIA
jgi:hypothetical protein